jgi:hypothetical protein
LLANSYCNTTTLPLYTKNFFLSQEKPLFFIMSSSTPTTIASNDGPVNVNLDITGYCPWMDEKLTLEARVTAYRKWQQLVQEARTAYKAEDQKALPCLKCNKMHPQPHIERERLQETEKAGVHLLRQWKKEQKRPSQGKDAPGPTSDKIAPSAAKAEKTQPKGKSAPTCPRCGRNHWPNRSGPGCKSPTCPKCQYNHWPQETCLDAQNRMRAAGLVIAAPQPAQLTTAQLDAAKNLGSLIAGGYFNQVPGALAAQVINQTLQLAPVAASNPGGPSTTPTHPSRKRKQKTPDTSEVDSEEEREKKKTRKTRIKSEAAET